MMSPSNVSSLIAAFTAGLFFLVLLPAPAAEARLLASKWPSTKATQQCPGEYDAWRSCLNASPTYPSQCASCMNDAIPSKEMECDSTVCTKILNCPCHSCSIETSNLATCLTKESISCVPNSCAFNTDNCLGHLKSSCKCPDSGGTCVPASISNHCKVPSYSPQSPEYFQQVIAAWNKYCKSN